MTSPADEQDLARWRFRWLSLQRASGNFALLRHRRCAGFMVSMHQSGTHWLKFMLANALAKHHDIPPPRYNHANDIIGGPRDPVRYPGIPRLLSAHSLPHPLMRWRATHQLFRLPPYLVLVRDPRDALVSNYVKWRQRYGVSFSNYLEGDPRGHRYNSDLWWILRFMNAWGALLERLPERALAIRYEDLRLDPRMTLERINDWFTLGLTDAELTHGINVSGKAEMAARDDPARPPGAVRIEGGVDDVVFSAQDRKRFLARCTRHLRYRFDYDLEDFSRISSA